MPNLRRAAPKALAFVLAAGFTAAPQTAPPQYKPVTAERLIKPDDGDWLMIRRTYDGWGYSPLDQIRADNVTRLQPVWTFKTEMNSGHEAPPLINGGVMFVATPGNQVLALDAKSGKVLWRYRRQLPQGAIVMHSTSRGVALYGDKVFFAAGDAALVALDARTGKEQWITQVADNASGYYMTLAPLIASGKVMVGASGGELGIRALERVPALLDVFPDGLKLRRGRAVCLTCRQRRERDG